MHKKAKSLVLASVITVNAIGSCGVVFADNIIKTSKDTKIERTTGGSLVAASPIDVEGGTGGRHNPYVLKANTEEGLDKIIGWLDDTNINISYYRLKDVLIDGDIKTYQLHVFDKAKLVSYINIKVDSSNTTLTGKLDAMDVFIGIEDMNANGTGTSTNPYEVKVNTVGGVTELIDWLIVNCKNYHRSEKVVEENGTKIYEIYAILDDTQTTYTNNKQEIYIKVVVDNTNDEVIDYLNTGIEAAPGDDFDADMGVNPDTDQVVDNRPVTLPDDVPVEDVTPEEEVKPSLPSIHDKLDTNVVDIIEGEGTVNNPLVLAVKPVTTTQLNTFLNGLNDLRPKVVGVTIGNTHTEYKLEVDNVNTFFNRMFKVRLTNRTTYAIIRVENGQTDLVKALNKFSKSTNAEVTIPSIVTFTDVANGFWAKTNIENFASMGLINGYTDGSFKPDAHITRAEFVKIVNNIFGYTEAGTIPFYDVAPGMWYYNEVAIAVKAGYINGKDATTFAPEDKITRQEVAKILTTIMKNSDTQIDRLNTFKDGYLTHDWAKPYVEGAIEAGYLNGDESGNLNPTNNITRAEAVTTLSRLK